MELSRRDALAALAAAGATAGGATLAWSALSDDAAFSKSERERLVALAEVVFPSAVEGVPGFVERYVVGRASEDPDRARAMQETLATLDDYAQDWLGEGFADLPPDGRDGLLREMGVDRAEADPDGLDHERVRYHLVDELLFALYTTPTGGELVGIENPIGHPGGLASYQRPPPGGREGPTENGGTDGG